MDLNIRKNETSLVQAWTEVTSQKSTINWALFGYEGTTFDLKVVSKGDGGLEEMLEDLNIGKILYAFCQVEDPKTSLPKFIFINWQGEGVPGNIKGICANHVRAVQGILHGAHVTVNARTEDDVNPEDILNIVVKSSVSAFNFKEKPQPLMETEPVSSVYKRIIPQQDINTIERDKFWEKAEVEEQKRISEEKSKALADKDKYEQERLAREQKRSLNAKGVATVIAHCNSECTRRETVVNNPQTNAVAKVAAPSSVCKPQATVLVNTPQNLENTSTQHNTVPPLEVIANSTTQTAQHTEMAQVSGKYLIVDNLQPYRPGREDAKQLQNCDASLEEPTCNTVLEELLLKCNTEIDDFTGPDDNTDNTETGSRGQDIVEQGGNTCTYHDDDEITQTGVYVKAVYDYQAEDESEITFDPGDIISNVDKIDDGWWRGLAPDGKYGLFPSNYVEEV